MATDARLADDAAPSSESAAAPSPAASGDISRPKRTFSGLAPFASHAYRYLFVGTALTMSGNFMQQVAQGWLVYDLTSSPTWLGIISFARGFPMLILALPAGVLIDRFDRRGVLIFAQGCTALVALVLSALIWSGQVQPWHVALTAVASGCMFVLIVPTRQALVPATVERGMMGPAIALMATAQSSGRVIGPSLAGVLIAAFGAATSFGVQAVGFLLAFFCSSRLPPQPSSGTARKSSVLQNLLEGVRYVRDDPTVFALISLQAIPSVLIMPYVQLLPIFARDILLTGPEGLGALMMANGIGAVLGAVAMVALPTRRQGIFLFASLFMFGLLLAAFAASTSFALSVGIMGLIGVAQAVYLATNNTLVQLATPDELRGRVMSVYMMTWGLMPLGSLPQGMLADWFGAPIVTGATGLLACLVVVVMAIRRPALRHM